MFMAGIIDLLLTPRTEEEAVVINHTNELVVLDKIPYDGDLPLKEYDLSRNFVECLRTEVPAPRANTYVLNIVKVEATESRVTLSTNYSTMRSQFALRRWIPELSLDSPERALILQYVLPIGGTMIIESIDKKILIEERGQVEVPGKYMLAPAGGCETRNWKVFPEPFRSIKGEAWEETGLLPGDYSPIGLIGVASDVTDGFNPTLLYHTTIHLPLEEIIAKAESLAPDAGEHPRLLGVDVESSELLHFCTKNTPQMRGNGLGGSIAFGNYKYGESWVHDATRTLEKYGWEIKNNNRKFPA